MINLINERMYSFDSFWIIDSHLSNRIAWENLIGKSLKHPHYIGHTILEELRDILYD